MSWHQVSCGRWSPRPRPNATDGLVIRNMIIVGLGIGVLMSLFSIVVQNAFPMRQLGASGIFELFVPDVALGALYKYEILTQEGMLRLKADPLSVAMERPPFMRT